MARETVDIVEAYRAQRHPETWPCDCCGENHERAILDAEGTGLCVECAVPLLTQQLAGAVDLIRELHEASMAVASRSAGQKERTRLGVASARAYYFLGGR